ncbi:Inosamine-phosphate amidinotransferase 1 [Enhygromyxa salina]|uniref:Inosamine-phosphate amidinotransferase 1 n=1 Tax=Enhygromyxa salina TaxID=215803 RepID=A0A0C2CQI4_9BACT|nr:Inosamine-phosphate amidinotransferase 1 [Enhygromyxa salina]
MGVPDFAQVPLPGPDLYAIEYHEHHASPAEIPSGRYDKRVIEETQEDLAELVSLLQSFGVKVRRPAVTDHSKVFGTPDWSSDGEFNYCPRDVLLPIGQTIIETPMPLRSRMFEPLAYKDLLLEYFESGANWISAPKPRLRDDTWNLPGQGDALANHEPLFDAANVVRAGRDIIYLVSCSGNRKGGEWLARVLGSEYRVHFLEGIYAGTHLDTTVTLLRPGLVMLNPSRFDPQHLPEVFRNWEVLWAPEMVDTGTTWPYPRASIWSGMNFFMVNPNLAVVNGAQKPLIKALASKRIETATVPLRHCRTLSGGLHCVTLDIRRRGTLEDYSG